MVDMLSRLPSWNASDALIEVLSALREVTPVASGNALRTQVGSQLPDGRWQIQAGDRTFALRLPLGIREGDVLDISQNGVRVVSQREEGAAVAAGGNRTLPAGLAATSQSMVSSAGRLIAELAGGGSSSARPAMLNGTAEPLVAAPADNEHPDFGHLADTLRSTVGTSGLFYESHLAEWVTGERARSTLTLEPQAHLPPHAASSEVVAGTNDARAAQAAAHSAPYQAPENATRADSRLAEDAALNAGGFKNDDGPSTAATVAQHSGIDLPPVARDLVREQINLLESRQLAWTGTIWPGQNMEWEIGESPQRELEPEASPAWYTRLKLTLPHLGQLDARLAWQPGGLRLRLAADEGGQQVLKDALPALQSALSAAGIPTGLATVEDHEHP